MSGTDADQAADKTAEQSDKSSLLKTYCGQWTGTTRTWFEPDTLADESAWYATIQPILTGSHIQYDYTGMLQGQPLEGKAIIGYNTMSAQFEMAWIDSFHQSAGIMFCKGSETATGFNVVGSYVVDEAGTTWGWRTTFEMIEPNHLTLRAFNIAPDGKEDLGIETIYTRK